MRAELGNYLTVLAGEPTNPAALQGLERIRSALGQDGTNGEAEGLAVTLADARRVHRERGDWELVVRLIDLDLALSRDFSRRADLFHEKGRILEDELLQAAEARECHRKALELVPAHTGATDALAQADLVAGNWEAIAEHYATQAATTDDPQLRTSLFLASGELIAKHGSDPGEAEQRFLGAIEADPQNRKAVAHLARLLRRRGDLERLQKLIERRAETAPLREERVAAYLHAADLALERQHGADAVRCFELALRLDPSNARAIREVTRELGGKGDWARLDVVFEAALDARPRPELELQLLVQLGQLRWRKVHKMDAAEEAFRRARKHAPAHPIVLDFYRAHYGFSDGIKARVSDATKAPAPRREPVKLLGILQAAQRVEQDAGKKLELSIEMARIAESDPASGERAIDLWKSVLKSESHNREARDSLGVLYRKAEKWNALLELLKDEVDGYSYGPEGSGRKIDLLLQVVEIYREHIGLETMVISTYQNILALRPDHEEALTQLAERYERLERWNDLIGVLEKRAQTAADSAVKATCLRRVAQLWIDRFANFNQAVRPLEDLVALDALDAEAIARLREIYTKRRAWRQLVELGEKELAALAAKGASVAERRPRQAELAKVAAERMNDPRRAIALWNGVLELDAFDFQALSELASLYERERRYAALAEMLFRLYDVVGDDKGRAVLLDRLATIFRERLGAMTLAADAYRKLWELDRSNHRALKALRDLYAEQGDLAAIDALYADLGHWDDLVDALVVTADRVVDRQLQLKLLWHAAGIARDRLPDGERAMRAFERVLGLEPQNARAAQALAPLYRKAEKWPRLVTVLELIAEEAPDLDGEGMLALYGELAQVVEKRVGSKSGAFDWVRRAYEIAPSRPEIRDELLRLGRETESWEALSDLLEARVVKLGADAKDERVLILRTIGQIALDRTHKPALARQSFEALLEVAPDDLVAVGALEKLYIDADQQEPLAKLLHRRGALEQGTAEKIAALLRAAQIEHLRLGRAEQAIETLNVVRSIDPDCLPALASLEELHGARAEWRDLVDVVERLATLQKGEARAGALVRLAEIRSERLDEPDGALEALRASLEAQPTFRPAVAALERELPAGRRHRAAAAALLAPIYDHAGDHARLEQALSILLDVHKDEERVATARRLADLRATKLGALRGAFEAQLIVLRAHADDSDVRRTTRSLAEQAGLFADYGRALAEVMAAALEADPETAAIVARELAPIAEERLEDYPLAEKCLKLCLDWDPMDAAAFNGLARLLRLEESWTPLRALLRERLGTAGDVDARREILYSIADLDEGPLDDAEDAITTYRAVIDLDPRAGRAMRGLEVLLGKLERWTDLDQLYALQAERGTSDEEIAERWFRRAELHATKLGDLPGAVDLLESVVGRVPRHEGARRVLERLGARAELRMRVADILEPLYVDEGAWDRLVALLEGRRGALDAKSETLSRTDLAERIAGIQEAQLGDRQAAMETWRGLLEEAPAHEAAQRELERLARALGRVGDLAFALERAAGALPATEESTRCALLVKVAGLFEEELRDRGRAIATWMRVLEGAGEDADLAARALESLVRLYEAGSSWGDLAGLLRRRSERLGEEGGRDADRRDLLRRLAVVEEQRLGARGRAIRTLREILELDSTDAAALEALDRLYGEAGELDEQLAVLRRRIRLATEPAERRALWVRVAQLTETKLKDVQEAISAWVAILDQDPDDLAALRELARLYEETQRPADLLEVLERVLPLVPDDREKRALAERVAGLLETALGRYELALERWRELAQADVAAGRPVDPVAVAAFERFMQRPDLQVAAAEALEPVLEARQDWAALVRVVELLAAQAPDARDRLARLLRVATLREQNLSDADGAFAAYLRAGREAAAEPELVRIVDALDRLVVTPATDRARELVQLYRDIVADVLDADLARRMSLQIADLARERLADLETAREYYRRVLDAQPDEARALDALETVYLATEAWEPLFELYRQRADAAEGETRLRYLLLALPLAEERLRRSSDAASLAEQAIELQPDHAGAREALERVYTADRRFEDLAALHERRAGGALGSLGDEGRAAVLLALGRLAEAELASPRRALDAFRRVLTLDASRSEAISALEAYLDRTEERAEAAEILEPVYAASQDWKQLYRVYEIRREATDDDAQKLKLTYRIAQLCEEQVEDYDAAFKWYGEILRSDPKDVRAREQLDRLASILDRLPDLVRLQREVLEDVLEMSDPIVDLARAQLTLCAKLADHEGAEWAARKIREARPDDQAAFAALESALTGAEKFRELVEAYDEAARRTDGAATRRELLSRAARTWEIRLSSLDEAVLVWREVAELDPDDRAATDAAYAELERLLAVAERWHDLVEHLGARIAKLPATPETLGDRVALWVRLGGIHAQKLQDPSAALDAYEEGLREDSRDTDTIAALEHMVAIADDSQLRVAGILARVYREHDRWALLVQVLEVEVRLGDDPAGKLERLEELQRVYEVRLDAPDQTWATARRLLALDPLRPGGLDDAQRVAEWAGKVEELVASLEAVADESGEPDIAVACRSRAARVIEERLGDRTRAIAMWRRVLDAREDDQAALGALERLHTAADQHGQLVEILERQAVLESDPARRKGLQARMASVLEGKLQDRDRAIEHWREVLSIEDGDPAALEALERLLLTEQRWRELADVLVRRAELASSPAGKRDVLCVLGSVYEDKLEDRFEAIATYRQALDLFPDDADVLDRLDSLYTRGEQWAELLEILEQRVQRTPVGEARDALRFRIGDVQEHRLGEPSAAVGSYRQVLEASPGHEPSLAALLGLVRNDTLDRDVREAATLAVDSQLRMRGAWDLLAETLTVRASLIDDPVARREILTDLALVHEEGRSNRPAAFEVWARVLQDTAGDVAAQAELERIAEAMADEVPGSWEQLASLFEGALAGTFDNDGARGLALRLALVYENRIGDLRRAIGRLRTALEYPGEEEIVLSMLDRLLEDQGEWADLAEVLEREASAAMEPGEQAGYLERMGLLRADRLSDGEGALEALGRALEREPGRSAARARVESYLTEEAHRARAIDILEPLYSAADDAEGLVRVALARAEEASGREARARHLAEAAALADSRLSDPARSIDLYVRAAALDPSSGEVLEALEGVAVAAGQAGDAAERLYKLTEPGGTEELLSPEGVREIALKAGHLALWRAADPTWARRAYVRALEADAECAAALEALERIERAAGEERALADVLARRARLDLDASLKGGRLREAAALYEQLGELAAAAEALRDALDVDETDAVALEAGVRVAAAQQDWTTEVELLERWARLTEDPATRARLRADAGRAADARLGDVARAVEAWRDVLDLEPGGAEALEALEALETRRGNFAAVAEVLGMRVEHAASDADRVVGLRKLATLHERELGSRDDAAASLERALEIAPEDEGVRGELERVLLESERFGELVRVVESNAQRRAAVGDLDGEVRELIRAALLAEEKEDDLPRARELVERALARGESAAGLLGLARLYEKDGETAEAARTLEKAAQMAQGRDAAEIHFKRSQLAADEGEAVVLACVEQALAAEASHGPSLASLEGILRQRLQAGFDEAAARRLLDVLARREAQAQGGERVDLLLERVSLGARLGEPTAAMVGLLEQAAALAPDDVRVLEALGAEKLRAGDDAAAEAILRKLADLLVQAARGGRPGAGARGGKEAVTAAARVQRTLGKVLERRGDAAGALVAYESAQRFDASDVQTLWALAELYRGKNDLEQARRVLRLLQLQNLPPEAVAAGVTKAAIYMQLGQLHEIASEPAKARNMYERGLEAEPTHEGLRASLAALKK